MTITLGLWLLPAAVTLLAWRVWRFAVANPNPRDQVDGLTAEVTALWSTIASLAAWCVYLDLT